jgi:hypothetical protein
LCLVAPVQLSPCIVLQPAQHTAQLPHAAPLTLQFPIHSPL